MKKFICFFGVLTIAALTYGVAMADNKIYPESIAGKSGDDMTLTAVTDFEPTDIQVYALMKDGSSRLLPIVERHQVTESGLNQPTLLNGVDVMKSTISIGSAVYPVASTAIITDISGRVISLSSLADILALNNSNGLPTQVEVKLQAGQAVAITIVPIRGLLVSIDIMKNTISIGSAIYPVASTAIITDISGRVISLLDLANILALNNSNGLPTQVEVKIDSTGVIEEITLKATVTTNIVIVGLIEDMVSLELQTVPQWECKIPVTIVPFSQVVLLQKTVAGLTTQVTGLEAQLADLKLDLKNFEAKTQNDQLVQDNKLKQINGQISNIMLQITQIWDYILHGKK